MKIKQITEKNKYIYFLSLPQSLALHLLHTTHCIITIDKKHNNVYSGCIRKHLASREATLSLKRTTQQISHFPSGLYRGFISRMWQEQRGTSSLHHGCTPHVLRRHISPPAPGSYSPRSLSASLLYWLMELPRQAECHSLTRYWLANY